MPKVSAGFYKTAILFFLLLSGSFAVHAQFLTSTAPQEEEVKIPDDSLGRRTPRGTVNGFIKAVSEQNYLRASRYMNLRRSLQKDKERERVVKTLQKLLDQGGDIIPYSWISDKSTGRTDDDLASGQDLVGTVTANGKVINLFVENTQKPDDPAVWQFSRETADSIAAITTEDIVLLNRVLPDALQDRLLAGVPVGHWLAVIVLIALSYLLAWSIILLIQSIIRLLWRKARTEPTHGIVKAFGLPFRLYLAVWFFVALSQQIGISIIVRQRFSTITVTVGLIAVLLLLWRLTDFISNFSKERMSRRGRISAISVILFLRRTAKVALIILGGIAVLSAIGVDVTTWWAALGIGGIALALGAQKTVENFVGSVTLIADQPVRVGDFCKVGGVTGTIEQIGIRSTKIRTGERTVVTIPNGQFASEMIENYAHRDRFLFAPTLDVRYETTPDQIRYLLVEIRAMLYGHPMVSNDPAKVRFTALGESSLKISVWSYIEAPNFDTFQEIQEDLLLRIMDIIAESGTDFAFPSQTLYLSTDKGISEEKTHEAQNRVKSWKEAEDMQLPAFDTSKIESLKGSIQYPPEGSVKNKEAKK